MRAWLDPIRDVAIIFLAIAGALLYVQERDLTERLTQANTERIADARVAQFEACQRANKKLRFVINQRIVRPMHTVVSIAATPSGDPAFDVFVPLYQQALDQIAPVPYAICRNTYPPDGSAPHPPFFRDAPLPEPLKPDRQPGDGDRRGGGADSPSNQGNGLPGGSEPPNLPDIDLPSLPDIEGPDIQDPVGPGPDSSPPSPIPPPLKDPLCELWQDVMPPVIEDPVAPLVCP